MGKPTQPLEAETEALMQAYAALNRNEIPGFVKMMDPQIERVEHFPSGATHHGIAAVTEHAAQARETWAEGSCEPEEFVASGDKVVVFVHVRVRLKHETKWREGQLADVFTFRNGKAIQMHTFDDRRQALEWAGVEASSAN